MKLWIWGLLLVLARPAISAELNITFADSSKIESSELVLNKASSVLHTTLRTHNYNGADVFDFSVGDGRHGPFNSATYARFSQNGDVSGNRILIDVNQFPILQVTDFDLDAGWRIEVIGNSPLIIYSLSDVKIAGEIWCHGEDGGNAVGATPGSGGLGRCGGGNGGDGGSPGNDGTDGNDTNIAVTGGKGGDYTGGPAVSGGGGGTWNNSTLAGSGTNSSPLGGQGGDSLTDPVFNTLAGGAGGGGGSGTPTEGGAGGGGGGGTVIIHAVGDFHLGDLPSSLSGRILASGGHGGSSNVAGGAGGGGGGGSVRIFVGGNIEMLNTIGTGAGVANLGVGGSNLPAHNGGNGGPGRNWYSSTNGGYNTILGGGGGYYTPGEQTIAPGDVQYTTVTQSAETIVFDLQNTKPVIDSVSTTPASSDFVVELKGSEDNFIADDTGWTSDLSQLLGKRYIKVKVSVTSTNLVNPDKLSAIKVSYTPGIKSEYDFSAVSCGRIDKPQSPWSTLILFLPFFLIGFLRRKLI